MKLSDNLRHIEDWELDGIAYRCYVEDEVEIWETRYQYFEMESAMVALDRGPNTSRARRGRHHTGMFSIKDDGKFCGLNYDKPCDCLSNASMLSPWPLEYGAPA